jgi:bacillithiol biosynthesis deacetylase BshB1
MVKQGRKVGVLDLTGGEMGTHGDEHDRAAEAEAAGKIMGLAFRANALMPDAAVEYVQKNKLAIAAVIRQTKPEMVILPHWAQRHPDHLACSRLGYDACFLAGLEKLSLAGEPHRPRKIIYASYYRNNDHSFLVDISDEFQQKVKAIAAYDSQFGDSEAIQAAVDRGVGPPHFDGQLGKGVFSPGVDIYDLLYSRSRALGQLVGVTFAEAYTVKEHQLVDDPQNMPVRSI